MAITAPVATVVAVTGHAFARDAQGNLRPLRPGDVLREGDTVVTSAGGRVELAFGDGTTLPVEQQQTVAIHADMSETTRPNAQDAQVSSGTVDQVIQALNDGGNLDDVEAPGAGMSGGGASESHDFVRLLRIVEGVSPLAFEYSTDRTSELDDRPGLALRTDADATPTPEPVTTNPPTEAPTNPPTEAPTNPPTEAPTNPPTEAPTNPPTEAPTNPPTTEPPTTQPPTTEPPTTQPPTTEPPTTQPPTTEPPTTQPPTTEPPTTEPPTTEPPTTEPPTTQPPTTEPPTTQPPTTEPPTTEPPTTEPPTTEPPTTEPPTTEPPTTEPPTTEPPTQEPPTADDGKVTGVEDTKFTFGWSDFHVSDGDSPATGIKVTSLPADGTLFNNGVAVTVGTVISKADIDAGKLVFKPDANESSSPDFHNPGTGNGHDDYAQFGFKPTDGVHEGPAATMTIDITPVADAPALTVEVTTQVEGTDMGAVWGKVDGKNALDQFGDGKIGTAPATPPSTSGGTYNLNLVTVSEKHFVTDGSGDQVLSPASQTNIYTDTYGTGSGAFTRMGITGDASGANLDATARLQLGYDYGANNGAGGSEEMIFDFKCTVTSAKVEVSNLLYNEKVVDLSKGGSTWTDPVTKTAPGTFVEQGVYELYRNGVLVMTGTFEGAKSGTTRQTLDISGPGDGGGFDQIVFKASDTYAALLDSKGAVVWKTEGYTIDYTTGTTTYHDPLAGSPVASAALCANTNATVQHLAADGHARDANGFIDHDTARGETARTGDGSDYFISNVVYTGTDKPTYSYTVDIDAARTDTDGSETLSSVTISGLIPAGSTLAGLAEGTVLSDGAHSVTIGAGGGSWLVPSFWDLNHLTITVPGTEAAAHGNFTITFPAGHAAGLELDVSVTSTEIGGVDSATTDLHVTASNTDGTTVTETDPGSQDGVDDGSGFAMMGAMHTSADGHDADHGSTAAGGDHTAEEAIPAGTTASTDAQHDVVGSATNSEGGNAAHSPLSGLLDEDTFVLRLGDPSSTAGSSATAATQDSVSAEHDAQGNAPAGSMRIEDLLDGHGEGSLDQYLPESHTPATTAAPTATTAPADGGHSGGATGPTELDMHDLTSALSNPMPTLAPGGHGEF